MCRLEEPEQHAPTQRMSALRPIPAVAVTVLRRHAAGSLHCLLIKRGKEPGKGLLALPGGSVERGESMLAAARRELAEEVPDVAKSVDFPEVLPAFAATDAIFDREGRHLPDGTSDAERVAFHYQIAHLCGLWGGAVLEDGGDVQVSTADDASEGRWCSLGELEAANARGALVRNVVDVVRRAVLLHEAGAFAPR